MEAVLFTRVETRMEGLRKAGPKPVNPLKRKCWKSQAWSNKQSGNMWANCSGLYLGVRRATGERLIRWVWRRGMAEWVKFSTTAEEQAVCVHHRHHHRGCGQSFVFDWGGLISFMVLAKWWSHFSSPSCFFPFLFHTAFLIAWTALFWFTFKRVVWKWNNSTSCDIFQHSPPDWTSPWDYAGMKAPARPIRKRMSFYCLLHATLSPCGDAEEACVCSVPSCGSQDRWVVMNVIKSP